MVLAAVCTPLIVLLAAAAVVVLAPFKLVAAFAIAAAIGIGGAIKERRERPRAQPVSPAQAPELHAIVDRLCVLADVPKPDRPPTGTGLEGDGVPQRAAHARSVHATAANGADERTRNAGEVSKTEEVRKKDDGNI